MNRCVYPAKAFLLGLLVSQVISTIQVFLSNSRLYQSLTAISAAGYLPVPNQLVMPSLKSIAPAFFGGLFFTFTVGAGLSVVSFATVWIWHRIFRRNPKVMIFLCLLWGGMVVALNKTCFNPLVSAYFLFIPAVVGWATLRMMPQETGEKRWTGVASSLIPLILLFLIWGFSVDMDIFVNIRDRLLLTNSFGKRINSFYYQYTLYPAEVIKTLDQKIIRTCRLEQFDEASIKRFLEITLLRNHYLVLDNPTVPVDVTIVNDGENIVFKKQKKKMLQVPLKEFLPKFKPTLESFAGKSDCDALFRMVIFYSLLTGLPIVVYGFMYSLFFALACPFVTYRRAAIIAGGLCLLIGAASFAWFQWGKGKAIDEKDLNRVLSSGRWEERVSALKLIEKKKLEIGSFDGYKKMIQSPSIPERYYLARAMGVSRKQETYEGLLQLLDDPHPNVVCMAYQALGKRKGKMGINEILMRMKTSDHWYEQWYAYKALWALGWKQIKLH